MNAYDHAYQALGATALKDATPEQVRTLFDGLSNAEYDFTEGIGTMSQAGNMDTICQSGSFNWKISFPDNDCSDAASMWKAAFTLATDEAAAASDIKLGMAYKVTSDLGIVNTDLDQWKAAPDKVRQDLGLPAQS
jgi:hypothetical protein